MLVASQGVFLSLVFPFLLTSRPGFGCSCSTLFLAGLLITAVQGQGPIRSHHSLSLLHYLSIPFSLSLFRLPFLSFPFTPSPFLILFLSISCYPSHPSVIISASFSSGFASQTTCTASSPLPFSPPNPSSHHFVRSAVMEDGSLAP